MLAPNPYWSNGVSTLYHADAREIPLPDKSVHMCVTSPPYWGLRDYGLGQWDGGDAECGHLRGSPRQPSWTGNGTANISGAHDAWPNNTCGLCGAVQQAAGIGLEPTLGEWVANIVAVMREVRRVLRDDGTVWLNLGDAYDSGTNADHAGSPNTNHGYWQKATSIGAKRVNAGLGAKQLMGQPWRVAFALQDDGADVAAVRALERVRDELLDAYEDEPLPGKVLAVLDKTGARVDSRKAGFVDIAESAIVWHAEPNAPTTRTDRSTQRLRDGDFC